MDDVISTGDLGRLLGCPRWLASRLVDGIPDTPRIGRNRAVRRKDVPKIKRLLEAYRRNAQRESVASA